MVTEGFLQLRQGGSLPGLEIGETDVPDLTTPYQRFHGAGHFFHRRQRIVIVKEQDIYIIGIQPDETFVCTFHQVLQADAGPERLLSRAESNFCSDKVVLSPFSQRLSQDNFRLPIGVGDGGIEEINTLIRRLGDHVISFLLSYCIFKSIVIAGAEGHSSKSKFRYDEAGMAELIIFHL